MGHMSQMQKVAAGGFEALRKAGVGLVEGSLDSLVLRLPSGQYRGVELRVLSRAPHPSELPAVAGPLLLIVPKATAAIRAAAHAGAFDLVESESGAVTIAGIPLALPPPPGGARRHHRPAWGRWAMMRTLYLAQEPLSQQRMAEIVGVGQSAVSQALQRLDVVRTSEGWLARDRDEMLNRWRIEYPGPGGLPQFWYGLSSVNDQATRAANAAAELEVGHLVSGDIAADRYAPWRLPAVALVYVSELVDFTVAGASPAEASGATLISIVPSDPTVWATAKEFSMGAGTVDPLIAFMDVLTSEGPDAEEAAEMILKKVEADRHA